MPAVGFRSAASDSNPAGGSRFLGIPKPSGLLDGDLLVASIAFAGGGAITAPEGWTLLRRIDSGTTIGLAIYWKTADNEPTQWVWDAGGSISWAGGVRAFTGCDLIGPMEADSGKVIAASATHGLPEVAASEDGSMLVASFAANGAVTYTQPTGYLERFRHANTVTADGADRPLGTRGTLAPVNATASGAVAAVSHLLVLRPSLTTITGDDVRERLVDLLPPGVRSLYDLDRANLDSFFGMFAGLADGILRLGWDFIEVLRRELFPNTAYLQLEDWERVLKLSSSKIAQYGTIAQRRDQVVAKLREASNSSIPVIQAICAPLLGMTDASLLEVYEMARGTLDELIRVPVPNSTAPAAADLDITLLRQDMPKVSVAGIRLHLMVTVASDADQISFTLESPGGASAQWGPGYLPAGAWDDLVVLRSPDFAGVDCYGDWTLTITNGSGDPAAIAASDSYLFVDAIGRDANGADGHGAQMFHLAVFVDSTKISGSIDIPTVLRTVRRIAQAHNHAGILRDSELQPGVPQCIPGQSLPGQCVPGA